MASIEIDGMTAFIPIGRVEVYARRERPARWTWEREPGSLDVAAGRFRLTVSKAPTEAERAASREARLAALMAALTAPPEEPQTPLRDAA